MAGDLLQKPLCWSGVQRWEKLASNLKYQPLMLISVTHYFEYTNPTLQGGFRRSQLFSVKNWKKMLNRIIDYIVAKHQFERAQMDFEW